LDCLRWGDALSAELKGLFMPKRKHVTQYIVWSYFTFWNVARDWKTIQLLPHRYSSAQWINQAACLMK
jgi:hypothetical protein